MINVGNLKWVNVVFAWIFGISVLHRIENKESTQNYLCVLSIYVFFSQSIGGCIVAANPTSDLSPVFMAARCTLLLATAGGIQSMFITATTRSP